MNRLVMMVLKNIFRVPGLYGKLCHYAKNTDKYPEEEKYRHIQKILRCAENAGNVNVEVYGTENIPAESGYLMYANHQGLFDVVTIVAHCDNPMSAVYKIELKNMILIREIAACTKAFAMDRDDVRQSLTVIQNVTEEVKKGRNYLIFPEGTRSKNGNVMGQFHAGSFRCATKSKCPVVPAAVVDCFKVLDEKGSHPLTVQLHYLAPIPYEEYQHMKPAELAELVKARIADKIQECTQGG